MKTVLQERASRRRKTLPRMSTNKYEDLANARRGLRVEPLKTRVALHPFFAGMIPAHLGLLTACAKAVHFRKGQTILRAGEFAEGFYLIESGGVTLESGARQGGSVILDQIGPGDMLGCSWMFPPYVWRFSAHATGPVSALFFSGPVLRARCEEDPALGYALLKRAAATMLRRMQVAP